jgi:hypothetical protein
MTKISNATPGPRGLHTKSGLVWVEGFETVDVEFVDQKQLTAALDTGWFVKGERKAPGGEDGSDVASLKEQIDRLTRANAALETENGRLKAAVEAAKGSDKPGLKAEHHGGGRFNVTEGETVLLSGLSKTEADAFNEMSPADQAKFIADKKS